MKVQRTMLHITAGDENWTPTEKELDDIKKEFLNVKYDKNGIGYAATRNGVFARNVCEFEADESAQPPAMILTAQEISDALFDLDYASIWKHKNGGLYAIVCIANVSTERQAEYPVTVVYKGVNNGKTWSRPLSRWYASFTKQDPADRTVPDYVPV